MIVYFSNENLKDERSIFMNIIRTLSEENKKKDSEIAELKAQATKESADPAQSLPF